jgi:hypothetical protein
MKTIKKNVYYCEYCNKRGLSAGHMSKHEKSCTLNINRICRVCNLLDNEKLELQPIIDKHMALYLQSNYLKPYNGQLILEDCNICPACALSVIRQVYKQANAKNFYSSIVFDYKKEMQSIFNDINSSRKEQY